MKHCLRERAITAFVFRMVSNFPHGSAMDDLFIHIRSLLQILDAEMYELMHPQGDLSHLYFCYRWVIELKLSK